MKNLLRVGFVLMMVCTIGFILHQLTLPQPVCAAGCNGDLLCGEIRGIPLGPYTVTATGNSTVDCWWAQMEADNDLRSQATCGFGRCEESYSTLSQSCPYGGPYSVTRQLIYKCLICNGSLTPCP